MEAGTPRSVYGPFHPRGALSGHEARSKKCSTAAPAGETSLRAKWCGTLPGGVPALVIGRPGVSPDGVEGVDLLHDHHSG